MSRPELFEEVPLPAEVRQLLRDFVTWGATERQWAAGTQSLYRRRVTAAHRWLVHDRGVALVDASVADLRDWLGSMPPTAWSRNISVQSLKGFWVFLAETGRCSPDDDPTATLKHLRKPKTLPKALDRHGRDAVLAIAEASGPRWHAAVVLALYEGLRATEIRTLEWTAFEGDWQWLRVVRKGSKPHVLPVHPIVAGVLQGWKASCPSPRWVFPSPREDLDQPMSDGWMRRRFTAIGDLADVVGLHPHQLRHTFATDLVEAGVDITTIQELMNHETPATTSVYLKVRPTRLVDAIGRLHARGGHA